MLKGQSGITMVVAEEQEIFHQAYRGIFSKESGFHPVILDIGWKYECLPEVLSEVSPDLLLIGLKKVNRQNIAEIYRISEQFPQIGMALLFMYYDVEMLNLLKPIMSRQGGLGVFLKESLEQVEQFYHVIEHTSKKQVIIDPPLAKLIFTCDWNHPQLNELTSRELEVLGLMADGYTNTAIAKILFIDIKTVHHHINSIYNKINADNVSGGKHPRVNATRIYLQTTGQLLDKSGLGHLYREQEMPAPSLAMSIAN